MFEKIRERLAEAERSLERNSEKPLNLKEKIGIVFNFPVRRTRMVYLNGEPQNWSTYSVNPNYWNIVSTGDSAQESEEGYKDGLQTVRRYRLQ